MKPVLVTVSPGEPLPPCDGDLSELYAYWLGIRPGEDRLPGRQHFEPLAVRRLWRWLWMLDVHRDPLRFKYRFIGPEHARGFARDFTGWWLDEAHPVFPTSPQYAQFVAVAEEGCVAFRRGPLGASMEIDYGHLERLLLPLAGDGRTVDILLAVTAYFGNNGQRTTVTHRSRF
jgi:hypothetical protein